MKNNPQDQTTDGIVSSLLTNESRQYTESAHAEIFNRLTKTINNFNQQAGRMEKFLLVLAISQVVLAIAQVFLGFIQIER